MAWRATPCPHVPQRNVPHRTTLRRAAHEFEQVVIAGRTHDESAAALTDALNNGTIHGAHHAIALDGEDDDDDYDSCNVGCVWGIIGGVFGCMALVFCCMCCFG